MSTTGLLGVGTRKGLFLFDRKPGGDWAMRDPILPEWEVNALLLNSNDPDHLMIGTSHWSWGPTIRESRDGGKTWSQTTLRDKDADGKAGGGPLKSIWQLVRSPDGQTLYAGVEEAALYKSDDGGQSWDEVEGLTKHESRPHWQPGGGGLCLHTILLDPTDPNRLWVGISAVGVFGTVDGGETWAPMNEGLPKMDSTGSPDENAMFCIHKMQLDPNQPGKLYMQFHAYKMPGDDQRTSGVFVSEDGAQNWRAIDNGLADRFGFPLGVSKKGELFIIPLHGDEDRTFTNGEAAVWRSENGGNSWQKTVVLDGEPVYAGVLRDAMAVDQSEPAGVYFGTNMGDLFASHDAGRSFARLNARLPRVHVVRAEVY